MDVQPLNAMVSYGVLKLNPQIIGKIRDGPTYSIYREEVEVVCQIPSGTIDRNEYPTVGGSSSRGESASCRTDEGTTANERTEGATKCERVRKHEGNEREGRPQVNQPGTLKEKSDGGTLFLEPRATVEACVSHALVNRS